MSGLTQRELLDLFDRAEAYPSIRAAIRAVLVPEDDEPIREHRTDCLMADHPNDKTAPACTCGATR